MHESGRGGVNDRMIWY